MVRPSAIMPKRQPRSAPFTRVWTRASVDTDKALSPGRWPAPGRSRPRANRASGLVLDLRPGDVLRPDQEPLTVLYLGDAVEVRAVVVVAVERDLAGDGVDLVLVEPLDDRRVVDTGLDDPGQQDLPGAEAGRGLSLHQRQDAVGL